MSLTFIVSVDTEEEFDWSAAGHSPRWSLDHVKGIAPFQEMCEQYGVRPTYLIDYPIATSDAATDILGEFVGRNTCEIGAHIHPWVNPPVNEEISPRNTYLCNLPISLQVEKVAVLTEAIRNRYGVAPTSFKAGRYGIDFALIPHLQALGYTVDSSVIAFTCFADDEGPDFSNYSSKPFWIGPDQADSSEASSRFLEVPCTVGFSRRPERWWANVHRVLANERLRWLHPIGILDRSRLLRKIVLSPELASASALITLMQVLVRAGARVLNLTLHSPSLCAGNTPFVQSKKDLDRFYATLSSVFEFATARLNATCVTLSEYRNSVLGNTAL